MKLLQAQRLKRPRQTPTEWPPFELRELGSEQLDESPAGYRVVACLNVWNDLAALKETLPTWYPFVDQVLAVDGAYASTGASDPLSTDGTREYLLSLGEKVMLITMANATQFEKRNAYLDYGRPGDLMFIVDADELVTDAQQLIATPMLDVGWVRIRSQLYARSYGQPRLIRWQPGLRYSGRHHWIYRGDDMLATHQYGGPGFEHRVSPLSIENRRGLGHSPARHTAKARHASAQLVTEAPACAAKHTAMSDGKTGRREALRIIMAARSDDGMAPSRLHTALNRTTPHSSVLFKQIPGPFGVPEGYSTIGNTAFFRRAMREADVVHFHVGCIAEAVSTPKQFVVMHHHGTPLRKKPEHFASEAKRRNALRLVSNLDLLTYAPDAHFLPNVAPVARYRRLHEIHKLPAFGEHGFRVAHSPSRPEKKGTEDFLAACERLKARGLPIVPVLIHGKSHAEALAMKASCHAAFDSFWLGMQCSGIEAAAMGLPVIAGDPIVAERYRELHGYVPYTFAENGEELEVQLARLIEDQWYRAGEALRVSNHVLQHHDESAVALRYLDLLDAHFGWRS